MITLSTLLASAIGTEEAGKSGPRMGSMHGDKSQKKSVLSWRPKILGLLPWLL